ncbi:copper amine oxidase N-terminal domain-containing protein [Neobacillus mesonae]|nr:copper amine oxidase N-terminal domain-containing protein [Neobacillus mesonae]
MKKIFISLVIAILLFSIQLPRTTFAASEESPIVIDTGKIVKGRTLIPIRVVSEQFGFKVQWNQNLKTVEISDKTTKITLKADSNEASINENKVSLDVPAQILKGTTYVPLKFLSQAFGASVKWDQSFKAAHVMFEKTNILIYTQIKPIPLVTDVQFKTFSQIANEAAVITDIRQAKSYFKPYFTDKLLGNIIWYKGLPFDTQFDAEKHSGITYKDMYNSEATITQNTHFVDVVWLTRTMQLIFTDEGWRIQKIDFKYLYL